MGKFSENLNLGKRVLPPDRNRETRDPPSLHFDPQFFISGWFRGHPRPLILKPSATPACGDHREKLRSMERRAFL